MGADGKHLAPENAYHCSNALYRVALSKSSPSIKSIHFDVLFTRGTAPIVFQWNENLRYRSTEHQLALGVPVLRMGPPPPAGEVSNTQAYTAGGDSAKAKREQSPGYLADNAGTEYLGKRSGSNTWQDQAHFAPSPAFL
ncbi:hypothetical protein BV898_03387 [Hypsibius exemplaris]|uniref:Uncharacterized protein n=1 Tax=Hypsibius exemplaris TaxID=2072580 RepID=A0A1W0X5E3_HYPEX|nr:hypothetical protein BV898_03387 [Hypsibius exemplaris]